MTTRLAPSVVTVAMVAFTITGCTGRTILKGDGPAPSAAPVASQNDGQLRVWFVKPTGADLNLVAVSRADNGADKLRQAVESLLKGPTPKESASGLATEIPRGTILLDVKHKAGLAELNVSRRFASGGGSDSLETRIEQLRKTVSEAAGNEKVYLDVEGQRLTQTGGEGLEIPQPLN